MKVLVIGYGSIGKRHTRLLLKLRHQVAVVSDHFQDSSMTVFRNVKEAVKQWSPEYIIVSNQTSYHYKTLRYLAEVSFPGIVLMEKPLFESRESIPENRFKAGIVAYNLRLHPVLLKLKESIRNKKIISVTVYSASFLPEWRPDSDYRKNYSASKEQGGGVLRDLSHELDYVFWIFGNWKFVTALGGNFSHLEINSDDVYSILIETEEVKAINIHLNYLDRTPSRYIIVNTETETIRADLVNCTFQVNQSIENIPVDRDFTYTQMHTSIISGNIENLCSFGEGIAVMDAIEKIEMAAEQKIWIKK